MLPKQSLLPVNLSLEHFLAFLKFDCFIFKSMCKKLNFSFLFCLYIILQSNSLSDHPDKFFSLNSNLITHLNFNPSTKINANFNRGALVYLLSLQVWNLPLLLPHGQISTMRQNRICQSEEKVCRKTWSCLLIWNWVSHANLAYQWLRRHDLNFCLCHSLWTCLHSKPVVTTHKSVRKRKAESRRNRKTTHSYQMS